MNEQAFTKTIKILLFSVLLVVILVYAKPFLVPVAFAALFSMLLLPLSMKLESLGIAKGLAIFFSVLFFVLMIAVLVYVVAWQVSDVSKNKNEIEKRIDEKLQEFKEYVARNFDISLQKQNEIIQSEAQLANGNAAITITGLLSSAGSFIAHLTLTIVYIFLFLYYRMHLKKFILMLTPAPNKKSIQSAIEEARTVAQKYITGLAAMIVCLWVMYSIGFSIVGVRSAVLFAILCGLLEIVPFVGNLTGSIIAIIAVVMQGGSASMILGVVVTYATVQFLQTYILEPLVVGKGVSINPLFTIAGIVAGELVWGIPGMILAIPFLGITKIFCDHIEPLKPYGFLIGQERKSRRSVVDKVKRWTK